MESYTIPEAADRTRLTPRAIREAIEEGRVSASQDDGRWRIDPPTLEWLEREGLPRREGVELDPVALDDLRSRVSALEHRLDELDAGRLRPRASMRSALAPLFGDGGPPEISVLRGGGPADDEPGEDVPQRSLGARRILGGGEPPDPSA